MFRTLYAITLMIWKNALKFFPVFFLLYLGLFFVGFFGLVPEGIEGHFTLIAILICSVAIFDIPFLLIPYTQKENDFLRLLLLQFIWLSVTAFSLPKRKQCANDMQNSTEFMKFYWTDGLCMLLSFTAITIVFIFFTPDISQLPKQEPFPFVWLLISYIQLPFLLCILGKCFPGKFFFIYKQKILPFLLLHGTVNTLITQLLLLIFWLPAVQSCIEFIEVVGLVLLYGIYFIFASSAVIVPFMVMLGGLKILFYMSNFIIRVGRK